MQSTCLHVKHAEQYAGSAEEFRARFNEYRYYVHRKFLKGNEVKQETFNAHFAEANHSDHDDLKSEIN